MNDQPLNPALNSQLELRDIHLPDPVSWWPLAPGWWILFTALVIFVFAALIARKIYQGRQLKREIAGELEQIKQQFEKSQDKSQLAKSLSILLRRVSITYNPSANVAGLTGNSWLSWLDDTHDTASRQSSANIKFQSDTGKVLLSAPYLPEDARLNFDSWELITLCESWLTSAHGSKQQHRIKRATPR